MNTWIVSVGAQGRDYTDDFFRFGMAFVGGDPQRESMKQVRAGDAILRKPTPLRVRRRRQSDRTERHCIR